MDLRTWVMNDLDSLGTRLARGVLSIIPAARMAERVDGGGIVPVYVAWHTARHHDLAVNGVLRGVDEVLDDWAHRVGVRTDTWRGLAEAEDLELVPGLDPEAVGGYLLAVIERTRSWVAGHDLAGLDAVPDSEAALHRIGAPPDRFDWLYTMWSGKPASFFLAWEAIGHGYNHLGELVTLRNRLGLSPF
ncbi:MAG: hypothetical protein ACE5GB_13535 [Acidimicrobiales bacterium]